MLLKSGYTALSNYSTDYKIVINATGPVGKPVALLAAKVNNLEKYFWIISLEILA